MKTHLQYTHKTVGTWWLVLCCRPGRSTAGVVGVVPRELPRRKPGDSYQIKRANVTPVDVPLIFFCPADHVPDSQPRVLLGMVEARSVNVKKTTPLLDRYLYNSV